MFDSQVGVTQLRHTVWEQAEAGLSLNSKIEVLCLHLQQLISSLALRITPVYFCLGKLYAHEHVRKDGWELHVS